MPTKIEIYEDELLLPHFHFLIGNQKRYVVCWGTRGSGKSQNVYTHLVIECMTRKNFKFLCIRKIKDTLRESIFAEIKSVIQSFGVEALFNINVSPMSIIYKPNGNKFIFLGADTKVKSIKNPTGAVYEEANEFTEEEILSFESTIRTKGADFLQSYFLFNPDMGKNKAYEETYLFKRFFEGRYPEQKSYSTADTDVVFSTFKQNNYLDQTYLSFLETLKTSNPYLYNVWVNGDFYNPPAVDRMAYEFAERHVMPLEQDQNARLVLTFDFNTAPYITLLIAQISDSMVRFIDEITLKDEAARTRVLARRFAQKYPVSSWQSITITGDASGQSVTTRSEKARNDYDIIADELKEYDLTFLLPKGNPPIIKTADFMNYKFRVDEIEINETCKTLIADLQKFRAGADGTGLKNKVRDREKEISYEAYGHCVDALRYLLHNVMNDEYQLYLLQHTKATTAASNFINIDRGGSRYEF